MFIKRTVGLFGLLILIFNCGCTNTNTAGSSTKPSEKLPAATVSNTNEDIITKIPVPILKIIGQNQNKEYKSLTNEDIKDIDLLFLYRDSFIKNWDNPDTEYDFSFLTKLNRLTQLTSEVRFKDYSVLNRCYNLKSLCLSNINDEDISKLTGLDSLLEFSIGGSKLSSLDFMAKYKNVRYLSIRGMTGFPAVDVLNGSMFLNNVYASNLNLEKLGLNGDDIASINVLKSAFYLHLNDNNIEEISDFPDAPYLDTLDLSGNPIKSINIPAEKAPNLKTLYLRNTDIEDLNLLKGFDNLTEINLSNTKVKRIAPLKKFRNLKLIEVDVKNIEDISFFNGTGVQVHQEI